VSADEQDVVVRDDPKAGRYELFVSGQLAGLATYTLSEDTMTIPHTEVQPAFEGRGLGARLAKFALDDARRRGLRVVPGCPFIAAYILRHPEYADLVAP
jgi:predicted GNAT family acetyltransferase